MRLPSRTGALPTCLAFTFLGLSSLVTAIPDLTVAFSGGLQIETTRLVSCERRTKAGDTIHVNYRGTLQSDGTEFDSSLGPGREPFSFKIGAHEVIKGWDQGLLDMCIGEGRRLTIPPNLAYGDQSMDKIPAASTLIFTVDLLGIDGVETVPPPTPTADSQEAAATSSVSTAPLPDSTTFPLLGGDIPVATVGSEKGPGGDGEEDNGECKLLGPFALLIQTALGILAVSSLVFKRWRESPRRPIKVWFFDASKQVFGSALLHVANLIMSIFSSGQFDIVQQAKLVVSTMQQEGKSEYPNPCSFYLLNLAIDTTVGIPILVGLLRLFHIAFSYTPMANPPESLKSGNYGHPPRVTWWLKQSLIYFFGLLGMKTCVFFLFQMVPQLGWVGDWALQWTEGKEWVQITFVMLIFPLIMNAMQYYIVDGFIKDSSGGDYGAVPGNEEEENEGLIRGGRQSEDYDAENTPARREQEQGKLSPTRIKEANPTPLPAEYHIMNDEDSGSSLSRDGLEADKTK